MKNQTYHNLVPPTTTTITVLGPDGFAAGKNNAQWALIAFQFFKIVPKRKRNIFLKFAMTTLPQKMHFCPPRPNLSTPGETP